MCYDILNGIWIADKTNSDTIITSVIQLNFVVSEKLAIKIADGATMKTYTSLLSLWLNRKAMKPTVVIRISKSMLGLFCLLLKDPDKK